MSTSLQNEKQLKPVAALLASRFPGVKSFTMEHWRLLTESERKFMTDEMVRRDQFHTLRREQPSLQLCKVVSKPRQNSKQGKRGKKKRDEYPRETFRNAVGTPRTLMPDEIDIEMPWVYQASLTNPGFAYASYRWVANGAYDPDPSIGGTSFIGLSEWGAIYRQYRVISYHWKLEVSNREAFPMFIDCYNSNLDPSSSVGTSGVLYAMNQYGRTVSLGPLGGGRDCIMVQGHVSLSKIFGSEMVETSPLFAGFCSGANPSTTIWFGWNTRSAVVQTSAGVYYTVSLRARVRLFERDLLGP